MVINSSRHWVLLLTVAMLHIFSSWFDFHLRASFFLFYLEFILDWVLLKQADRV